MGTESESIPLKEQLDDDRYFYCPICGEKDMKFFEDVLITDAEDDELDEMTDEQRSYLNDKNEYGVDLCEQCRKRLKRKDWLLRGMYLIGLILLYCNIIIFIVYVPFIFLYRRHIKKHNFTFKQAWEHGAVRRLIRD